MDFDWMDYQLPADIVQRNAEGRVRQQRAEARLRAGLLRRLGYDQAHALHRVLGNQAWAWEMMPGKPAVPAADLKASVVEAYTR